MASIVTDALSNVMSIRANPASAMESASNGFKVSGELFNTITSALDKKELEHQVRIDAQQKIIDNLEMTRVEMANQRELKALSQKYAIELNNLGYSHSQGLEATRFSHSKTLKGIDQTNKLEYLDEQQTNKLEYLDEQQTNKLEYLKKEQSYEVKKDTIKAKAKADAEKAKAKADAEKAKAKAKVDAVKAKAKKNNNSATISVITSLPLTK